MILFHGTTADRASNILANGFELSGIDSALYPSQARLAGEVACLFAFDSYDAAENYILNQGRNSQAVISFEIDNPCLLIDPEYDSGAYILTNIDGIKSINIVWCQKF